MRWKWLTPGDKRSVLIMTVALVLAMLSGVGLIAGFLFLAYVVMWAYLARRRGRQ